MGLPEIPDYQILSCAYIYIEDHPEVVFWTEDNLCLIAANKCFDLTPKAVESSSSGEYTGWIDRDLADEEIAAVSIFSYRYRHTHHRNTSVFISFTLYRGHLP
jgi:hypothetical protein